MHAIIAGATGLIGKRLVKDWLTKDYAITVVGRDKKHIQETFGDTVTPLSWPELSVEKIRSATVVVNLAGANIGEKHWKPARKEQILNSRVDTTATIASLLAQLGKDAPLLLNASAVGVYGLQVQIAEGLPPALTEETSINHDVYPDFLAEVGRKWEKAATPAVAAGCRVIFLRFGVVLAKEGGALPELLKPLALHIGGKIGTGRQPFSWVALDDVISAINYLIAKPNVSGAFNIVAPEAVSQQTFAEVLSRAAQKKVYLSLPSFLFEIMLGKEMARELLFEGQHVYPKRLLELGYRFDYPELSLALPHILNMN
jgi:uncharacterized protein